MGGNDHRCRWRSSCESVWISYGTIASEPTGNAGGRNGHGVSHESCELMTSSYSNRPNNSSSITNSPTMTTQAANRPTQNESNDDVASSTTAETSITTEIPDPPLGYWLKKPLPDDTIPSKEEFDELCRVESDEANIEREALFSKTHRLGNVGLSLHQFIQHVAGWALKCHEMRRWLRNVGDWNETNESPTEMLQWDAWSAEIHLCLETLSWHQRQLEISLRSHMALVHRLRDRLQQQYEDMLRERQRWVNRGQRFPNLDHRNEQQNAGSETQDDRSVIGADAPSNSA